MIILIHKTDSKQAMFQKCKFVKIDLHCKVRAFSNLNKEEQAEKWLNIHKLKFCEM